MAKTVRLVTGLLAVAVALMALWLYWGIACEAAEAEAMPSVLPYAADGGSYAIDLNTADAELLSYLPNVGEKLAARIVEYRQTHGEFETVEELMEVEGIGEKTLERLRPLLTITRSSP